MENETNLNGLKDIAKSILDTIYVKNYDYDSAFDRLYDKFGFDYALGKLYEKMHRIMSIRSHGKAMVNSESMEDSIRDLCGYCLLTLRRIEHEREITKMNDKGRGCNNTEAKSPGC